MSYILEALKKSEHHRSGEEKASTESPRPAITERIPDLNNKWLWLFAVFALNLVLVGWVMFADTAKPLVTSNSTIDRSSQANETPVSLQSMAQLEKPKPLAPKSTTQSSLRDLASKSATAPKPANTPVPKPAQVAPQQPKVSLQQLAESQRKAQKRPVPTPPPMPVAPQPVQPPVEKTVAEQTKPVIVSGDSSKPIRIVPVAPKPQPSMAKLTEPPAPPAQQPAPAKPVQVAPVTPPPVAQRQSQVIKPRPKIAEPERISQSVTPANKAPVVQADDIPLLTELDIDYQRSVPTINVNVHVFSDVPEERFVLIDMRRYPEGSALPGSGPEIVEITPTGIIFVHRGKEFLYLVR